MKRIALGVITKNHTPVVYEVLSNMVPIYKEFSDFGFDIYYLDSSDNDDTEAVVSDFRKVGCSNLYYRRFPADTPVAARVKSLFLNEGLEDEYDYYWPVRDRAYYNLSGLLHVYGAACQMKYDMIILDCYGASVGLTFPSTEYDDPAEFYRLFGWIIPSMDSTLYGRSVIQSFDWSSVKEDPLEYTTAGSFLHFMTAFYGLAGLAKPHMYVIHEPGAEVLNHSAAGSGWVKDTFLIWKEQWVDVNDHLPAIYDPYKDEVIRGPALPKPMRSEEGMRKLKEFGAITPENIDFVLDGLERVTDVPKEVVRRIALEN